MRSVRNLLLVVLAVLAVGSAGLAVFHKSAQPAYTGPQVQAVPAASTVIRLKWPANPRILFFGDSWTDGQGASTPDLGWASLAGRKLGASFVTDGGRGTGYLNPGSEGTYLQRWQQLADRQEIQPNVVVLQGGLNDAGRNQRDLTAAVATMISAVRHTYPDAALLIVGPLNVSGGSSDPVTEAAATISTTVYQAGVAALNPTYEGWFNARPLHGYENQSDGHPNDDGHAEFARRFLLDVQVLRQP